METSVGTSPAEGFKADEAIGFDRLNGIEVLSFADGDMIL